MNWENQQNPWKWDPGRLEKKNHKQKDKSYFNRLKTNKTNKKWNLDPLEKKILKDESWI